MIKPVFKMTLLVVLLAACGAEPSMEPIDAANPDPVQPAAYPLIEVCRECRPDQPHTCPSGRCEGSPEAGFCCVDQPFPLQCRWGACEPTIPNRCTALGGRCEPVGDGRRQGHTIGHCCNFGPQGSAVP